MSQLQGRARLQEKEGKIKISERILGNRREGEEAWCRKSKNAQRVGQKVEVVEYLFSYHASITY